MDGSAKRIMVDMSATLIHHGHIRILKAAKELGDVIVALTTDEEIHQKKGYPPELNFNQRREIIAAICYVDEIVPCPWLIDEAFLDTHKINFLVHGHDNSNPISSERLVILPRTEGVSSTLIRSRVLEAVAAILQAREIK